MSGMIFVKRRGDISGNKKSTGLWILPTARIDTVIIDAPMVVITSKATIKETLTRVIRKIINLLNQIRL